MTSFEQQTEMFLQYILPQIIQKADKYSEKYSDEEQKRVQSGIRELAHSIIEEYKSYLEIDRKLDAGTGEMIYASSDDDKFEEFEEKFKNFNELNAEIAKSRQKILDRKKQLYMILSHLSKQTSCKPDVAAAGAHEKMHTEENDADDISVLCSMLSSLGE